MNEQSPMKPPIHCPACGNTAFTAGARVVPGMDLETLSLHCARCRVFVRLAQPLGSPPAVCQAADESRSAAERAGPDADWHWFGLVSWDHKVWQGVACCATARSAWDAIDALHGECDRMIIPVLPRRAVEQLAAEGVSA